MTLEDYLTPSKLHTDFTCILRSIETVQNVDNHWGTGWRERVTSGSEGSDRNGLPYGYTNYDVKYCAGQES